MTRHAMLTAALGAALLAGGCAATRTHHLTESRYRALPEDAPVRLYVNTVAQPHLEIAQINSFPADEDTPEIRREQLEDLQARARRLGGDAVVNIRSLKNKGRGWVPDDRTPFDSYRMGDYQQFFLRGTAIRFEEAPAAAQPADPAVAPADIPQERTADTEDPTAEKPTPRTP
ncbi:MAG: hypothetical protein SF028_13065 [Candidatus Sumerlaeia bacterium]|nr:hypothetical protein [Candidatus Sumerlaeia bacterium]